MKPFRDKVALAVDGGGYRGIMVARALDRLEEHLGVASHDIFSLTAGTSTGSIISAGIHVGLRAKRIYELYEELGQVVFRKTWRSFWPLSSYKYSNRFLADALRKRLGETSLKDFWASRPDKDLVITVRDLMENRTRFIKPWKIEYGDWTLWKAVLCSCSVPTYFPVVDGRFVDGGVGAFKNPCYVAAFEACYCLGWNPETTTLISIGTGRHEEKFERGHFNRYNPLKWIRPLIDTFISDADDLQVRVVRKFFEQLDFRRFQIDIQPIAMDDHSKTEELTAYGDRLGEMILSDEQDQGVDNPHGHPLSLIEQNRNESILEKETPGKTPK